MFICIDGCSGSWHANYDIFTEACIQHDICYSHNSKDDCDGRFKFHMDRLCDNYRNDWLNSGCHSDAGGIYTWVNGPANHVHGAVGSCS